jgi:two-component system, sensor histidine kinase and response regulator
MTNERDLNSQNKEALEQRIQQLEKEVSLLEERLRHSKANTIGTRTPEGGLIKNSWLIPFGQYLLIESDKANISDALEKLGKLFDVIDCSLWRINAGAASAASVSVSSWHCLGRWQKKPNPELHEANWLTGIWRKDSQVAASLNAGKPVALLAADPDVAEATAPLRKANVFSSLLVPVLRYNLLEGFVVLHRDDPRGWYTRDLDRLMFIATALFNLHDRQQLLTKLSDRDTRFNYAIEASSDGLWDWNISSGKIYFSRSYLRMLGYYYEDLPGNLTTLHDYFLYSEDTDAVMQRLYAAIETGETYVNLQHRMQHQNGKVVWVQSKMKFCEPDDFGKPTRCVGLNNNINDFILAREDLLEAKTQADMANKTKSEFLARMSHEIRTPMNAIIGLGYLLKDTNLDEQQKSYLGSLNSASDSLLHIINEVLDFSKIDSGRIILEHSHFDLDQLFEKISRLFEINAIHKAVRIIYDIKADVPRFLRGDAARLSQVIDQLISNALQFSETNEVIVGVKLREANIKFIDVEFSVSDFGVGISSDRLACINDSLKNHITMNDAGNLRFGLGICDHLVQLMGGTMHIDSAPQKGCSVVFSARFDHSHLGSRLLGNHKRELKNIKALIVDDNAIARTVMKSTAKSIGLIVDDVETAEQALAKIAQANVNGQPFHVVLMDYRMPAMDGIEAAAAIKHNTSLGYTPHVILVSAYHRDEISSADNSALNVDEFLSKPVSEARLLETISSVISKDEYLQGISAVNLESTEQDEILKNARILVAEDNLVNQQVVRGVLKKKAMKVTVVNNGLEAIDAVNNSKEPFDLILMDLEMPEMDGISATQAIRAGEHSAKIPIVALTAQAMRGDRERCIAAGMNAYLSKPINPELLYKTLMEQLREQSLENGHENLH